MNLEGGRAGRGLLASKNAVVTDSAGKSITLLLPTYRCTVQS